REPSKAMTTHSNTTTTAIQSFRHASTGGQHDHPPMAPKPHSHSFDRRELRKARRLKDAMRLERELKRAQIEHAYAQHWVMLTYVGDQDETGWRCTRFLRRTRPVKGAFLCEGYLSSFY